MSSEPEEVKTPVRVCRAFHKLFGFQYANVLYVIMGFNTPQGHQAIITNVVLLKVSQITHFY